MVPQSPSPTPFPAFTPTEPPPPISTPSYQPNFEPAPCAFPIPDGYTPECGYLVIPENRARSNSSIIRLHVAIFHTASPDPAPDPVVHLAGGPGSSALGLARYMFQQGLGAVLERRDLILFDQRGTGYSLPRLDCPERNAFSTALLDGSLPPDEENQAIVEAFRQCHARLANEGIDLSSYNSAASAADVNDLRLALGYAQMNLYGISYGTRLALTILRDYPEGVRSIVLDSTYPLEVNLYTSLAPNAERAFNVLFANCASDLACNAAHPDLRGRFYTLVDQLNTNPVEVQLDSDGSSPQVLLDGNLLVDVLFVGLYNPVVIAQMPAMIEGIRQGDYNILRDRLWLYFDTSAALGMQMSVQCSEEIPFGQPEEAFALAQGVQPQIAAFFPASVQPLFTICQEWNSVPFDPRENQPVTSSLPALILAGEYDPITPPDWGRSTTNHLTEATFFEFAGNGHWVTRSSRCALEIALAFWENPAISPDSSCLTSPGGIDFFP